MKIIYIKETEEIRSVIKRIKIKIKKFLNIIERRKINEKTIYYLPISKDDRFSNYRIKKITHKINKLLKEDEAANVVLSEYLNTIQLFRNYIYSENINILDGRYLFKCLTYKAIEDIFNIKRKKVELRRSNYFS